MIRYIGNKLDLSDFILPFCPKNPKYWIEPFGGMMGLYFSLNLKEYPDTKFIYNDINPLNSNLFDQLKSQKFINRLDSITINEDIFNKSFEDINSRFKSDRALAWLIILCSSNMKDLMSREYVGSSNFEIFKYKIKRYKEYFDRLEIHNLDYKKIIQKYDTDSDTFIYLDPPYKGYSKYYTFHNFDDDSHFELFNFLSSVKSNWILSSYNFTEMKEWYKDHKIVSKKQVMGTEFLIIKS